MLLARVRPSPEASATWARASWLLRLLWFGGERALLRVTAEMHQELGVTVQGGEHDPFWLVIEALSADAAMNTLRRRNVKAYTLLSWDLEGCKDSRDPKHECNRQCRAWFNERGTGPAQLMGLDLQTCERYFAGGVELVAWLLQGKEGEAEPAELKEWLA